MNPKKKDALRNCHHQKILEKNERGTFHQLVKPQLRKLKDQIQYLSHTSSFFLRAYSPFLHNFQLLNPFVYPPKRPSKSFAKEQKTFLLRRNTSSFLENVCFRAEKEVQQSSKLTIGEGFISGLSTLARVSKLNRLHIRQINVKLNSYCKFFFSIFRGLGDEDLDFGCLTPETNKMEHHFGPGINQR